jgi:hypothetical protein
MTPDGSVVLLPETSNALLSAPSKLSTSTASHITAIASDAPLDVVRHHLGKRRHVAPTESLIRTLNEAGVLFCQHWNSFSTGATDISLVETSFTVTTRGRLGSRRTNWLVARH